MPSRVVELATQILANANKVDGHLRSNNLPQPSFDVDGPLDLKMKPAEIEAARLSAIEASMELQDLLLGPTMLLRPVVRSYIRCCSFPHSSLS